MCKGRQRIFSALSLQLIHSEGYDVWALAVGVIDLHGTDPVDRALTAL
jgi:hypothetical protein